MKPWEGLSERGSELHHCVKKSRNQYFTRQVEKDQDRDDVFSWDSLKGKDRRLGLDKVSTLEKIVSHQLISRLVILFPILRRFVTTTGVVGHNWCLLELLLVATCLEGERERSIQSMRCHPRWSYLHTGKGPHS
jgi:hypothetical protein